MHRAIAALGVFVLLCGAGSTAAEPANEVTSAPSRLCVVWTSGDPEVAKNVCFMYTGNAKKRGWFGEVHLRVWGPSAKLLAGNKELQAELQSSKLRIFGQSGLPRKTKKSRLLGLDQIEW